MLLNNNPMYQIAQNTDKSYRVDTYDQGVIVATGKQIYMTRAECMHAIEVMEGIILVNVNDSLIVKDFVPSIKLTKQKN